MHFICCWTSLRGNIRKWCASHRLTLAHHISSVVFVTYERNYLISGRTKELYWGQRAEHSLTPSWLSPEAQRILQSVLPFDLFLPLTQSLWLGSHGFVFQLQSPMPSFHYDHQKILDMFAVTLHILTWFIENSQTFRVFGIFRQKFFIKKDLVTNSQIEIIMVVSGIIPGLCSGLVGVSHVLGAVRFYLSSIQHICELIMPEAFSN